MIVFLQVMYQIIQAYIYVLFVYIILSWTPIVNSKFYQFLRSICDPYMNIFRGKLIIGQMDFGGIIGLLLLQFLLFFIGNAIY